MARLRSLAGYPATSLRHMAAAALLAASGAVLAPLAAGGENPAPSLAAQAAPSSPPDGVRAFQWRQFSSRPGGFQVDFPGRPEVSRRRIRTEVGDVASVRHTAGDGVHATYDVTYTEYPPDSFARLTPEKLLTAARDSLVYQSKGRLVSDKRIVAGKAFGRECEITGADGMRYDVRLLAVANRIYQISAIAQPPARPDTRRFFDSFRLAGGS